MCQGRQGASRGIAEGAHCRQLRGQEHVDPLIRFALDHPEQAPVHHLERIGFQRGEQEEQPIFRRRQGAVFVHGKLAGGPEFPVEAPHRQPPVRCDDGALRCSGGASDNVGVMNNPHALFDLADTRVDVVGGSTSVRQAA